MIKTGGIHVAPLEVEEVLLQHADVAAQAHVVGVPDLAGGEVDAAAVELRTGAADDTAVIVRFCRERLASYKVPTRLVFRSADALRRTATGKIHKPSLAEELAGTAVIDPFRTLPDRRPDGSLAGNPTVGFAPWRAGSLLAIRAPRPRPSPTNTLGLFLLL
jgi:acyl-CoA synthetase (AMP-forming)/AMP-acid ligase II